MLDFSRTDSQSSSCSQRSAESKSQLSGRGSRGLGTGVGLVFLSLGFCWGSGLVFCLWGFFLLIPFLWRAAHRQQALLFWYCSFFVGPMVQVLQLPRPASRGLRVHPQL